MEKIIVFYSANVELFLNTLTNILFKEEYFSYKETAQEYVDKITFEIENDIPFKKHFETPKQLAKYGKYYVNVKGSKRTTWYVFFDKKIRVIL